jgi:hypothetical protein
VVYVFEGVLHPSKALPYLSSPYLCSVGILNLTPMDWNICSLGVLFLIIVKLLLMQILRKLKILLRQVKPLLRKVKPLIR